MKRLSYVFLIIALLAVWSCSETEQITKPAVETGGLSFARFHAIGNSLTAGVQSGGLVEGFQNVSVVAMVSQAAGAAVPEQPIVSENGIPPLLYVEDYSGPTISRLPTQGVPTNSMFGGIYNNLGVPGATLNQLLTVRPGTGNPLYAAFDLVLRDSTAFGKTAVDQMVNASPTTAMVWVGANDVLGSATAGTDLLLTPLASFEADYITMMDAITGASDAAVAGNLPDVTAIPFFTTLPPVIVDPATREPVLDPGGNPIFIIGVSPGSLVLLTATTQLSQGIGVPVALGGTGDPLPGQYFLDPAELAVVRQATSDYNAVIDSVCANRGVPVADMFTLMNDVAANGAHIHGDVYTTDFLTGGLFSVDGVHPSSLGYWLAAREFVRAMNAGYGAAIPDPRLPVGPLRDPGLGASSSSINAAYSISEDEWRGVLEMLKPRD